jgi:hypothetical protein
MNRKTDEQIDKLTDKQVEKRQTYSKDWRPQMNGCIAGWDLKIGDKQTVPVILNSCLARTINAEADEQKSLHQMWYRLADWSNQKK